jgi:hypothetical protein
VTRGPAPTTFQQPLKDAQAVKARKQRLFVLYKGLAACLSVVEMIRKEIAELESA